MNDSIKYTASGKGYEKVPPPEDWCPNLVASQKAEQLLGPPPPAPFRSLGPWMRGIGIGGLRLLTHRFLGLARH